MEEHFELIYRKTACLFSVCMKMGGILANASEADQQRLAEYGRNLGMAFQIVDDVLDLTASEEVLGKPVASDLREGKATMAVLHALEHCTPTERETIESVLSNGGFNGITPADIVDDLEPQRLHRCRLRAGGRVQQQGARGHLHLPRFRDQARAVVGSGVCGGAGKLKEAAVRCSLVALSTSPSALGASNLGDNYSSA